MSFHQIMSWFTGVFSSKVKRCANQSEIEYVKKNLLQDAKRAGYTDFIEYKNITYRDGIVIVLRVCRWTSVSQHVLLYLDYIVYVYSHHIYTRVKPPYSISKTSRLLVTPPFTIYLDFTIEGDAWMDVIRDYIHVFLARFSNICPCCGVDVKLERTARDNILKLDFKLSYYIIMKD